MRKSLHKTLLLQALQWVGRIVGQQQIGAVLHVATM